MAEVRRIYVEKKEDFAVVTGMMPSGQMHIGHKMVVDQLIWYQQKGAMLSLPIADYYFPQRFVLLSLHD